MTDTPRNEAAERLLDQLLNEYRISDKDKRWLVDEALAAERRATVERIRYRVGVFPTDGAIWSGNDEYQRTLAILDTEAER